MVPRYPRARVIYVDVDGTLLLKGQWNLELVEWLKGKHAEGYEIVVWTSRGKAHAELAVEQTGLAGVVSAALAKPGVIVDDRGWGWRTFTRVCRSNEDLWGRD